MADYSRFGIPSKEWQEHLEKCGPLPEVPVGELTALEIQRSVNSGREQRAEKQMHDEDLASKVDIQTINISARDNFLIPIRIYSPKNAGSSITRSASPVYVFYHGGGFVFGTLDGDDPACCRIVSKMDIVVISVDYRHAPKYPFPAAHHDALDAFDWVAENADFLKGDMGSIVVGGVSAGASLAVHVALERCAMLARHYENYEVASIKGLLLGIPWLVINEDNISYEEFASKEKHSRVQCSNAPVLPAKTLKFFVECMGEAIREKGEVDPDVGLIGVEKLKSLPNTTILVAGNDPVRDEGIMFAQKLQQAGVPVKVHVFPGLPHGFRKLDDLPSSRRWDELLVESIKWSLKGPAPSSRDGLSMTIE